MRIIIIMGHECERGWSERDQQEQGGGKDTKG
jgi:hypothetical protein